MAQATVDATTSIELAPSSIAWRVRPSSKMRLTTATMAVWILPSTWPLSPRLAPGISTRKSHTPRASAFNAPEQPFTRTSRRAVASGGLYDEGTATASLNHVQPYLKSVLGFLGVTDTAFVSAGGSKAIAMGQVDAETFLQPHFDSIQAHLASAA